MKFALHSTRSFTLDINPAKLSTAQEKGVRIVRTRGGRHIPMFYKKSGMIETERLLKAHLSKKKSDTIRKDGNTAVELRIIYQFPYTSSHPKWMQDQLSFMTERPDVDNLSKSLIDCMTELGFWEDDSMVFPNLSKYRSPNPCIRIQIRVWKQSRDELEEHLLRNS